MPPILTFFPQVDTYSNGGVHTGTGTQLLPGRLLFFAAENINWCSYYMVASTDLIVEIVYEPETPLSPFTDLFRHL